MPILHKDISVLSLAVKDERQVMLSLANIGERSLLHISSSDSRWSSQTSSVGCCSDYEKHDFRIYSDAEGVQYDFEVNTNDYI